MNSSNRWAEYKGLHAMCKALSLLLLAGLGACSPDKPSNGPVSPHGVAVWVEADPFGPAVQEAARFAVQTFAVQNKARLLFKDVTQARQQLGAGLQFELDLQVTLEGAKRHAKAIVWRQPDGVYALQSWAWLD
jgi:hypothetical protein